MRRAFAALLCVVVCAPVASAQAPDFSKLERTVVEDHAERDFAQTLTAVGISRVAAQKSAGCRSLSGSAQ